MFSPSKDPLTRQLDGELQEFLLDRQARNLSPRTVDYYARSLAVWRDFLLTQAVTTTESVTPTHIRRYLVQLAEKGHTPGGIVTLYTALRVFLRWYIEEYTPANWNPLAKIKAPKRPKEILPPLALSRFQAMVDSCERRTFSGDRDRALLMLTLDTGIRHQELTDLLIGDVDLNNGQITIRSGKGRKSRAVFIGTKTRRALLAYFRHRESLDNDGALWVKNSGETLTKSGIRQVVRRAADRAGVDEPGMHEFRRAFAINSLRNGMDVATLQRLLGHSSLEVVLRYLDLVDDDLRTASGKYGVVDGLKG